MILPLLSEAATLMRQWVTGRPYKRVIPRQFYTRIVLTGAARTIRGDSSLTENDGEFPFVLTAIDAQPATNENDASQFIPASSDNVVLLKVYDQKTGKIVFGNGAEGIQLGRLRAGSTSIGVEAYSTPLAVIPGGGHRIGPDGGFIVEIQTYDSVNNDNTGDNQTIDVLLVGYHIVEE